MFEEEDSEESVKVDDEESLETDYEESQEEDDEELPEKSESITPISEDRKQVKLIETIRKCVKEKIQSHELNYVLPVFQNNIVKAESSEIDDGFIMIDIEFDQDLAKHLRCLCDENLESSKEAIKAIKISECKKRVVEVLFTFVWFSNFHDPDTAKLVAKLFDSIVGDTAEVEIPKGDVFPLLEQYFLYLISQLKSTLPEDPKNYVQILNGLIIFISNLAVDDVVQVDHISSFIDVLLHKSLSAHKDFSDLGLSLLSLNEKHLCKRFKLRCLKKIEEMGGMQFSSGEKSALNVIHHSISKWTTTEKGSSTSKNFWKLDEILEEVSVEELRRNHSLTTAVGGSNTEESRRLVHLLSQEIDFTAGICAICRCLCEHRRNSNEIAEICAHLIRLGNKPNAFKEVFYDSRTYNYEEKMMPFCDFLNHNFWKVLKSYVEQYLAKISSDVMVVIIAEKITGYFRLLSGLTKCSAATLPFVTISLKLLFETGDRRLFKIGTDFVKTLDWDDDALHRWLKMMPLTEGTRKIILEISNEESTV